MKRVFCGCWLAGWMAGACPAEAQTGAYLFNTIAGEAGTAGSADGTNQAARFSLPGGLAVDGTGNLYVSDILNNTIRKITPQDTNWVVTTIAGQAGVPGSADGTNQNALLDRPNGLAVDRAGNIFVADHYNHTIRKLTLVGTNWIVSTIAGLAGVHGSNNGTNSDARFWSPTGIAVDTHDNLFVTDTANFTVREIVPVGTNWVVSTIAGLPLQFGFIDGTNTFAEFDYPYGITVDSAGRLYVADWGNNALREIDPIGTDWAVHTIAGTSGATGSNDGPGWTASFNGPVDVCVDSGGSLYVTDQSNNTLRRLIGSGTNWVVSTIGGVAALMGGNADGLGTAALFNYPWGIALDAAGKLYVSDYGNQTIRSGQFFVALGISLTRGQTVLSWPAMAGAYAPQVSAGLSPSDNWSMLPQTPVTNGASVVVVDPPRPAPTFYRLVKVQISPSQP